MANSLFLRIRRLFLHLILDQRLDPFLTQMTQLNLHSPVFDCKLRTNFEGHTRRWPYRAFLSQEFCRQREARFICVICSWSTKPRTGVTMSPRRIPADDLVPCYTKRLLFLSVSARSRQTELVTVLVTAPMCM